jgi:predicted phosphodiesterase
VTPVRYGVLADVHGNLQALRAVLGELDRAGVDRYLIAGDLVGYGPNPNECVEVVAGLDAVCVAGNHDLIALDLLSDERCPPLARQSLRWTRGVLTDDARAFLASLPLRARAPGGIVIAHGSLDDPQEYTRTPEQAVAQLTRLSRDGRDRLLLLGHTHRPWAFDLSLGTVPTRKPVSVRSGDLVLLNPGGAGQSRSLELRARGRFVLLDLEEERATFFAVHYELELCRQALRRAGLSPRSCHIRPSVRGAGRRARRKLTGGVRALLSTGRSD